MKKASCQLNRKPLIWQLGLVAASSHAAPQAHPIPRSRSQPELQLGRKGPGQLSAKDSPYRQTPREDGHLTRRVVPSSVSQDWSDRSLQALFGLGSSLCSKEYFLMEYNFYTRIALAIVMGGLIKNVGPGWTEAINKDLNAEEAMFKSIRKKEINF